MPTLSARAVGALVLTAAVLCACQSGRSPSSAGTPVPSSTSATTPSSRDAPPAAVAATTLAGEGSCANIDLHQIADVVKSRSASFAGVVDAVLGDPLPARWDNPDDQPPSGAADPEQAPPEIYTPWQVRSGDAVSGTVPEQVAVIGGVAGSTEVIGPPSFGVQAGSEVFVILDADTVGGDGITVKVSLVLPIVDQQVFIAGCVQAGDFPGAAATTLSVTVFTGRENRSTPTTGHLVPKADVVALFA